MCAHVGAVCVYARACVCVRLRKQTSCWESCILEHVGVACVHVWACLCVCACVFFCKLSLRDHVCVHAWVLRVCMHVYGREDAQCIRPSRMRMFVCACVCVCLCVRACVNRCTAEGPVCYNTLRHTETNCNSLQHTTLKNICICICI